MERKIASLRRIDAIDPIPGADAIEVATVGGWKIVVKKNEFFVGELAVYCEIDCWIPNKIAPFLSKGQEPRLYEGVLGERLRTIRLRGQISQGLLLKALPVDSAALETAGVQFPAVEGMDVSEQLGIRKWEAPVPAQLAGQVEGLFPSFIRKTDQERCQNLVEEIFTNNSSSTYEVTLKLDGSSATFFHLNGSTGVCSRNLQLKVNEENAANTFVRMFVESNLQEVLPLVGHYAIQGELCGEGIQGNREKIKGHKLFVFDVQDIKAGRYLTPEERLEFMHLLFSKGVKQDLVQHVPVLSLNATLSVLNIQTINDLIAFADGPSLTHQVREGVVFKRMDGGFSFKSISNKFLMAEGG